LISDRIKSPLPDHVLKHLQAIEANSKDGRLPYDEMAEAIDIYTANYWFDGKPRDGTLRPQPDYRPAVKLSQGQQQKSKQLKLTSANCFAHRAAAIGYFGSRLIVHYFCRLVDLLKVSSDFKNCSSISAFQAAGNMAIAKHELLLIFNLTHGINVLPSS
jgi:hypothetical protein